MWSLLTEDYDPERCSNTSLRSFGICVTEDARTPNEINGILEDVFGKKNVEPLELLYTRYNYDLDINEMYSPNLRQFLEENPTGHFMVYVTNHAIAVHDGWVVDTMRIGPKNRHEVEPYNSVEIKNNDKRIEDAFALFRKQEERNGAVFAPIPVRKKKTGPTRTFTVDDVFERLEGIGYIFDDKSRAKTMRDIEKIIADDGLGRWVKSKRYYRLSQREVGTIVRAISDMDRVWEQISLDDTLKRSPDSLFPSLRD